MECGSLASTYLKDEKSGSELLAIQNPVLPSIRLRFVREIARNCLQRAWAPENRG